MKSWTSVLTAFLLTTLCLGSAGSADESSVSVPGNTKFVVKLDVQAFQAGTLNQKLLQLAEKFAKQEFQKGQSDDKPANYKKMVSDVVGFDPLQEIKSVVISGSDYDHPEKTLVITVQMGKSTGNLEGLMLALPEYAAQEYGKHTIHTAAPDKDQKVYGSFHTDVEGNKTLMVTAQRDSMTRLLDSLDRKSSSEEFKTVKLSAEGRPFLSIEVLDIPAELIGEGPQSGVAKIVRTVGLRLSESDGSLKVGVLLGAGTEKQAEQLQQMAQGLMAMANLAFSFDSEDQDLKNFRKYANDIKVTRDGLSVKLELGMQVEELNKIIDEEFGDK